VSGVRRYDSMGFEYEQGRWVRWADYDALLREREELLAKYDALLLERNNLEGSLQLSEEALYFFQRDAKRYEVVRSHAADVTPEEMDRGADAIIAQRAALKTSRGA
jgi:hypothetical protein